MLINLVGNAIKFTEGGEVVASASKWRRDRTSEAVSRTSRVRDTGIGIPANKQQMIFEAFSQADGSTTRKYGGTGLGLTISSQLVGLMGGRVWVESEAGAGSTFHFTIHVEQDSGAAETSLNTALTWSGSPFWLWTTTTPTAPFWRRYSLSGGCPRAV